MTDFSSSTRGILLMNLGSPDSTEVPDVKRYLDEFLMDKRVIDYPYLFRLLLVRGMITPKRAPKTAEAYRSIWWPEGSPLIVLTERLREALEARLGEPVAYTMRYGDPHPAKAFAELLRRAPALREVVLFPLYPHYAMSSYETAVEYARQAYRQGGYPFRLRVAAPYYREPAYIHALAETLRPHLEQPYDYLLFSYHGVPERHIRKGDITGHHCLSSAACCDTDSPAHAYCYRHQVITTMRLVARELGLPEGRYGLSFQSRLGREEWLRPYTAELLRELPARGIRKLVVLSPAFVSDCLETLEEMAMQGREQFLEAGGESYRMVPCLNTDPLWVDAIAGWLQEADQHLLLPG